MIFASFASKLRGRLNISKKEVLYAFLAGFLDTVFGGLILILGMLTKEVDIKEAQRIIDRVNSDVSKTVEILKGVDDPSVMNLSRNVSLLSEKLTQIYEEPFIKNESVIDLLEKIEESYFYIRDMADDIALEKDSKKRKKIVDSCNRRMDYILELVERIIRRGK